MNFNERGGQSTVRLFHNRPRLILAGLSCHLGQFALPYRCVVIQVVKTPVARNSPASWPSTTSDTTFMIFLYSAQPVCPSSMPEAIISRTWLVTTVVFNELLYFPEFVELRCSVPGSLGQFRFLGVRRSKMYLGSRVQGGFRVPGAMYTAAQKKGVGP